jgi:hypothetical protein
MQTVLKKIITKFNNEFDKQKFLDWFNETKEDFLIEERQQIVNSWISGKENDGYGFHISDDAEKYYNETFKHD